jgi:hypothetical protein
MISWYRNLPKVPLNTRQAAVKKLKQGKRCSLRRRNEIPRRPPDGIVVPWVEGIEVNVPSWAHEASLEGIVTVLIMIWSAASHFKLALFRAGPMPERVTSPLYLLFACFRTLHFLQTQTVALIELPCAASFTSVACALVRSPPWFKAHLYTSSGR